MKKASSKAVTPANLGTKRTCPKCSTKFYDFGKEDLSCPKCETRLSLEALVSVPKLPEPKRRTEKPVVEDPLLQTDEVSSAESEMIESVEELGSDEEDLTEEVEVDEDEDEEKY